VGDVVLKTGGSDVVDEFLREENDGELMLNPVVDI